MKTLYVYNAYSGEKNYPYAATLDHNTFLYLKEDLSDTYRVLNELTEDQGWCKDEDVKSFAFTLSEETNPELFV